MLSEFIVTCMAVLFGVYCLYMFFKTNSNSSEISEPPGPWGLPVWGHLLFFGKNPGVTFTKWAEIYGPIFSIKFGSIPAVVLNDANIIKEALSQDSFSGRTHLRNFVKPCKMKGIVFTDGPRQTEQRKFAFRAFKGERFSNTEIEFTTKNELSIFLQAIQKQCKNSFDNQKSAKLEIHHFFRFPVLNSLWVSIMGHRISEDDPRLNNLTQILETLTDASSSVRAQMSFFFPWVSDTLTYLKINSVVNGFASIYSFMGEQIEESRKKYVAGKPENLMHAYFDLISQNTDPESSFFQGQEQRFTVGDIFFGAADTTTASLDWLLLYMAREPHVQQKLQAEIDDIVGYGAQTEKEFRTPSLSDRAHMPYTDAVIKELLRITSTVPFAVFHRTLEEVHFKGYRIPKDTMIVPNLYGIHHDPDVWSEPNSFQPERFLEQETGTCNIPKLPRHILPFGSGKRSCIGERFARDQLFLTTTHFFQRFTVSCTDNIPSPVPVFRLVLTPQPFELLINERNVLIN